MYEKSNTSTAIHCEQRKQEQYLQTVFKNDTGGRTFIARCPYKLFT